MAGIYDTIRDILTANFAVPADAISKDTENVLTDSLDVVEFGVVAGERPILLISDEELVPVSAIGDVARLISDKVAA